VRTDRISAANFVDDCDRCLHLAEGMPQLFIDVAQGFQAPP
jgi:hypothetical protein